jgi:hypothetical protein
MQFSGYVNGFGAHAASVFEIEHLPQVSPQRWYWSIITHGVTSQNNA